MHWIFLKILSTGIKLQSTINVTQAASIQAEVSEVLEGRDGVVSLHRRQWCGWHGRRRRRRCLDNWTRHRSVRRLLLRCRIQAPDTQRAVIRHRVQLSVDHLRRTHAQILR